MSNRNENEPHGTVRQMKVSPALSKILSESLISAKQFHHQFFTPEHVLAAALKNRFVENLLEKSGADCQAIRDDVYDYLKTQMPVITKGSATDLVLIPQESVCFQNMMNAAVFHSISNGSNVIDVSDMLVGLLDSTKCYGSYFLRTNGLEKEKLLENISLINPQKRNNSDSFGSGSVNSDSMMSNNSGGLERFAVNMTEEARKGHYDKLIGREEEIERTIQVLCRRVKNNPLHVGDAGVGKTCITQGLAQRIIENKVPEVLKDCVIYSLDIGLLLAGSKFRGDFEERLHSVIDEIKTKKKAILFIDEIHMIMGAGTNGNTQIDAANLLKPALASGEIKVIGSTTYEEYSKNFEKDRALSRRFQKIDVVEPTPDETKLIIKGVINKYENFHKVKYTQASIEEAVKLSIQYLPDRRLPDKALDIIDEAGSYLHIVKSGGFIGNNKKANDKKDSGIEIAEDALVQSMNIDEKSEVISENVQAKNCAQNIAALNPDYSFSKNKPLVTPQIIRRVTAKITKLPVETVEADDKLILKEIEANLEKQIFGQEKAVLALSKAVKRARAGFRNGEKPEGCFLFVGPTGCGKTELAKALSVILKEPLLRYDMSEYQEKHTVSRLVGSPPGYVGFEEGGQLTKDVRKNPHSIILFDEIEKAHEDIYNVLLQVMDYGQLTDNQGRKSDFRNCIIILTSNAGARELEKGEIGFGTSTQTNVEVYLNEAVNKEFPPEFRNRLDAVIPFNYLSREIVLKVCKKEIDLLAQRMVQKKVILDVTPKAIDLLTDEGYSKEYGARNMARTVEDKIADPLVDEVLFGRLSKGGKVKIDCKNKNFEFIIN